jgi:flagellar assembly protein FliH
MVNIDADNFVSLDVPDISEFLFDNIEDEEEGLTEEEALSRAEQIVADAENEAEEIKVAAEVEGKNAVIKMKEQAKGEIEGLKAAAYNEAYEAGRLKGEAEAEGIIAEAEEIKERALVEKEEILNSAEPEIVELVADVVKKLIGGAFEIRPELILFLVKQGLSATTLTGNITVHVSEDDYGAVIADKNELLSMAEAGTTIEIIKDVSLNAADCIIETKFGNIDCSLDKQYGALKESLFLICKNRFIESADVSEAI